MNRAKGSRLRIKRAYDPPAAGDGIRVLVDRLWPRGLSKEKARIDEWVKDIAPSDALRRWFGHDPDKWAEFERRYAEELSRPEAKAGIGSLRDLAAGKPVTLVFSAADEEHNNAVALREFLEGAEITKGKPGPKAKPAKKGPRKRAPP